MNVYVVIGYDSLFDGEEVRAIFDDKTAAEEYQKKTNCFRVEEFKVVRKHNKPLERTTSNELVAVCNECGLEHYSHMSAAKCCRST